MSILSADILSISPRRPADAAATVPQSSSGQPSAGYRRGWWSRFGQKDERRALREIADDPHLLYDLGLTREQALHEAEKPFWR
ncbi:hypothetical protein JQ543_01750 [Bradyrhizobium diazoefficiens]|nr:hypothetical protein [Bradyrhizobium diazoefficiens]MBR0846451.1 hypothetical protein [Bradyrhizobium diazoefficiens]